MKKVQCKKDCTAKKTALRKKLQCKNKLLRKSNCDAKKTTKQKNAMNAM